MDTEHELDDLDRQLREAAPYIDDAGFTHRVMVTLPSPGARRQRVRAAILFSATVLASLFAYLLSGGGRFVSEGVMRIGQLGPIALLAFGAVVCTLVSGVGMTAVLARDKGLRASVWSRN